MPNPNITLLERIREGVFVDLEDAQEIISMIRDGDLIHIDEVYEWSKREEDRERAERLVEAIRVAGG
jgi:hypothetical protein